MSRFKPMVPIPLFLIALLTHASPGAAQEPAALEQEANGLASVGRSGWARAAALYTEAAGLRTFGDDAAIADLRTASMLRYYIGDRKEALRLMTEAAGQAIASGKVLAAAESYVEGAWIAVELGSASTTQELAENAILLAGSPHLTIRESRSILDRFAEQAPVRVSGR